MSAQLALDLDHDAIRLLSRQSDGWVVEGVAVLNSDDITAGISRLRQRAEDLAGDGAPVTLVLPRSQVLYAKFDDANPGDVANQLEGLTPYAVSDITWDYAQDGDSLSVAAVAHETLNEALSFAQSSRFNVVGLTSEPPEGLFPRLPVFTANTNAALAPMVLEPETPPDRIDVAFSNQRSREYGPRAGRLTLTQSKPTGDDARSGLGFLAGLAAVPKPALAAAAAVAVIGLGIVLWPERDPDPFVQRGFEAEFAALPIGEVAGLTAPTADAPPAIQTIATAALVRRAPDLTVPVVLGTSDVGADAFADVAPADMFASWGTLTLLDAGPVAPALMAARPTLASPPTLDAPEAPLAQQVALVTAPLDLSDPNPVNEARPQTPTLVGALSTENEVIELAAAPLPDAAELTFEPLPGAIDPPDTPQDLLDPPQAGTGYVISALASDPVVGRSASFLPEAALLAAALPDTAMALTAPTLGSTFELGPDGFVTATPEGTLSQSGVLVFAGIPERVAPARPEPEPPAVNVGDPALAAIRPQPRPVQEAEVAPVVTAAVEPAAPTTDDVPIDNAPELDAAPQAQDLIVAVNVGDPALAAILPRPRPERAAELAALAPAPAVPDALIEEALAAAPGAPTAETTQQPPEAILAVSLIPRPRPDRPTVSGTPASASRAVTPAPRIPSSANVAREATIQDGIRFQQINLVGVYGSAADRRALVRLPSGRFVKLQVGDRLDGGQVAQIGPDSLVYRKGSRNLSLQMPNS